MSKDGIAAFIGCVKSTRLAAPSIDEMSDAIAEGRAGKTVLLSVEKPGHNDGQALNGPYQCIHADKQ